MAAFEVRRTKPIMVSVTTEAASEVEALWLAQEAFVADAKDDDAYEVTRQPPEPGDNGDTRSEARYEQTDTDSETERREDERWSDA